MGKRWNQRKGTKRPAKAAVFKSLTYTSEPFEKYYRAQGIVPEAEWDQFLHTLRQSLPCTIRISQVDPTVGEHLRQALGTTWSEKLRSLKEKFSQQSSAEGDAAAEALRQDIEKLTIEPLDWFPGQLGWKVDIPRHTLRRWPELKELHKFITAEYNQGHFVRQELVSMVPVFFLDVQHDSRVLDICAAPGSKTTQILEAMNNSSRFSCKPVTGCVVANDVSFQRCKILVTQTQHHHSMAPHLVITSSDARWYPSLRINGEKFEFDRILCDVVCSGDGTLRKSVDLWERWNPLMGSSTHKSQTHILKRAMNMLRLGGRIVYSTCSLNPLENEAVVASCMRAFEKVKAGRFELVDVSEVLPGLRRCPGLSTWKLMDKDGTVYETFDQVPEERRRLFWLSMFPQTDADAESNGLSPLHLERCMRFLPHLQDSGGFFVAVLQKVADRPPRAAEHAAVDEEDVPRAEELAALDAEQADSGVVADGGEAEDAAPPETKPRTPREGRKVNPLTDDFVAMEPEAVEHITQQFALSETFPKHLLMRRARGVQHKCLLVGELAKTLLDSMRESKAWNVVGAGLRLFEGRHLKGRPEAYRASHEGLGVLRPYLPAERVVRFSRDDALRLLQQPNRTLPLDQLSDAGTKATLAQLLTQLPAGPPFALHSPDGYLVSTEGLLVACHLTPAVVIAYVSNDVLKFVLYRMGALSLEELSAQPQPAKDKKDEDGAVPDAEEDDPSKRQRVD